MRKRKKFILWIPGVERHVVVLMEWCGDMPTASLQGDFYCIDVMGNYHEAYFVNGKRIERSIVGCEPQELARGRAGRRKDLQGLRLVVASLEGGVGMQEITYGGPHTALIRGFWGDIFNIISRRWEVDSFCMILPRLNLTYSVECPGDMKWGSKDSSGKWTGMIGLDPFLIFQVWWPVA